jgi:hypothetical protein
MKFVKVILIAFLAISTVFTTEETTYKMKKAHHRKSKAFLQNSAKTDPTSQTYDQFSNLAKTTNMLDMVPDQDPSVIDLKLGPGPVHFQGWVKYFKFDSDENQTTRPTTFFKNMEFYQQSKKFPNADLSQQEDGLNKYIKNEMFFFSVLNYDSINIYSSKLQQFQQTYDTVGIDLITPQIEDRIFKGGITDFGNFSEGFCFRVDTSTTILTQLPNGNVPIKSYIICTENAVCF